MISDIKRFSSEAMNEISKFSFIDKELSERRKVSGFTIDGEYSLDLDDGFNIFNQDDHIVLQISIADVAHFVRPGSAVFKDALLRVESVYLRNYTIPMLPTELSENKLSLLEKKPTPAITFEFLLNNYGRIEKFDIFESIFTSLEKINYPEFEKFLLRENNHPNRDTFILAAELSQKLLKQRRMNGAFAFYDIKHKVYTDEEGHLLNIGDESSHNSHILIQEFMIMTNNAVAEFMAKNDVPFLYRNHTTRIIAPDRDEILNQYNTALQSFSSIESLNSRYFYWFNRATYDPQLKGHFGLNLNAYTHITSPIRRMADLINQLQLKCLLNSKVSTFDQKGLEDVSVYINEKITEHKDEKAEHMKQKAVKEAEKFISINEQQVLKNINSSKFAMVLKSYFEFKNLPDGLFEIIRYRLDYQSLDPYHMYLILFREKKNKAAWNLIIDYLIGYVTNKQGLSSQILNTATQKNEILKEISEEINEDQMHFRARIKGLINNKFYSTASFAIANNKKEASFRASNNFLIAYLNNELVPVENTIKQEINNSSQIDDLNQTDFKNYVGFLNEFQLKNDDWSIPEFTFYTKGMTHNPEITCNCEMTHFEDKFVSMGIGCNKKTAKQLAAKEMYEIVLSSSEMFKSEKQKTFKIDLDSTDNYTGLLLDYCQKNRCKHPKVSFIKKDDQFCCTLIFSHESENYTFTGYAPGEKNARKAASLECLQFLIKNGEIVL